MAEDYNEYKKFVNGFNKSKADGRIHIFYENYWNKINEKFKSSKEEFPIADKIHDDKIYLFIYKEICYRYFYYNAGQLTLEQRVASWENYTHFWEYLLSTKKSIQIELPPQWTWDIIDEFLYQYQEFCHYRSKHYSEVQKLDPKIWNTVSVLKYLHSLINDCDIIRILEREKNNIPGDSNIVLSLFQFLGYFSIIGLCRMHCILGDYYMAIKVLDPIELNNRRSRYFKSITASISLYYYAGFSYMMVRRYQDAIKTFNFILLHTSRMNKPHYTRQYDQKKIDQMYSLLAILLHFSPRRIDETILSKLKEEHGNKLLSSQKSENQEIGSENFYYSCPKFVSPFPEYDEDLTGAGSGISQVQRKIFLKELNQCAPLPVIGSYLKLYTTIHSNNLANLLDQKPDKETLRMYLLRFVHKNRQLQNIGQSPIKGNWTNATDVDFYLDGDMVHVIGDKIAKNYADLFMKKSITLEEIRNDIQHSNK